MKLLMLTAAFCLSVQIIIAQNVGIGTNSPGKTLSVAGSIVVDHDNKNRGSLDSAGLIFGANPYVAGISSNKNPFHIDFQGLNFWTNKQKRMTILSNGYVGINDENPQYPFSLNGNMYVSDNATINNHMRINQRLGIGGQWDYSYKLAVQGGNSLFHNKVHIGASTNASDQLYVQSSGPGIKAARFLGGDVEMDQNLSVGNNLVIENNLSADGNLTLGGNAYIGGATDPVYRMRVYGNARVDDNFRVNGKFAAGGAVDENYFSRTYGNAKVDEDLRVDSKVAVGGAVDNNFKLRVYGGNSRFGGDVEVTGNANAASINADNMNVANNLTIKGSGHVRSNGTSPLKIHFVQVFVFKEFTQSGELAVFEVSLPDFSSKEDVRLSISHFETDYNHWFNPDKVLPFFTEVDPVQNRAMLVFRSLTGTNFILGGTYYISVIMKES